ncbi:hypothetical protein PTRA_a0243 [Pseudoalteromonas translucida KMM 520]|uniref:Uncharacterized protein n=1 Tax=Pseudoalteromonas translucida KMM 520 TaxID=1315283 RepID=A0A0U2LJY8_9GAMM|nr:hypothetical protein PTRA_a0243 [Pseudoalteromonas translucida KMM 520]
MLRTVLTLLEVGGDCSAKLSPVITFTTLSHVGLIGWLILCLTLVILYLWLGSKTPALSWRLLC